MATEKPGSAGTDAERFLSRLGGLFTFQTFGDDKGRKVKHLARVLHGDLHQHTATLAGLNARGAGVFVMVNEGDGHGRTAGNVQRVRAYFVDLDGAALEPIQSAPLPPHLVVESSPGRWHAYWLVSDAPLDQFRLVQQALAERFHADDKVCDLPRVMRLPGFDHRKGEPFRTRIVELHDHAPYAHARFVEAFVIATTAAPNARTKRTLPAAIAQGERNATLLSLAAGLVRRGTKPEGVNARLQRINAERCQPPLSTSEVDTIAARASHYGSDGFTLLPHRLLDSSAWAALAPPAHDIILLAFRRYDGSNNGNISLTVADFTGRRGFHDKTAFYKHRAAAVASGIVLHVSAGGITQTGRKPDLFAIAAQWLHDSAESGIQTMRKVGNPDSYIDKQFLGLKAESAQSGAPKTDKAA